MMERISKRLIYFFILLTSIITGYADNKPSYNIQLTQSIYIDDEPHGNRMPPRPINCIICADWITISDIDISDVTSYNICTKNGTLVNSFSECQDFLNFLFSLQGNYLIQFQTSHIILTGYINI